MSADFFYGIEVFLNGLMAGVMYSLVALGFVLIFKASGIFNYAQGIMALFAALTLVLLVLPQVRQRGNRAKEGNAVAKSLGA